MQRRQFKSVSLRLLAKTQSNDALNRPNITLVGLVDDLEGMSYSSLLLRVLGIVVDGAYDPNLV